MINYRKQFDDRFPQLETAIDSMSGNLDSILPGFTKQRLKRFFQRFSILFGRLDKNGAKQPQFLTYPGSNVPDAIFANIDNAISQMGSGAATFGANVLHTFVDLQEKMERAVGLDATALNQISLAAAKDLGATIAQADELLEHSKTATAKIEALVTTAVAQQASLQQAQQTAKIDTDSVADFRKRVEQLLSSDGRQRVSLDSLVKRVQHRETEIEAILKSSINSRDETSSLLGQTRELVDDVIKLRLSVQNSDAEAKKVLGLSAQAGLARSYLTESTKLERRSNLFTGLLYLTVLITIGLAAFYVLPSLEHAIESGTSNQQSNLLVTLLRASILAPLVFVLYFTTKQISAIETLRMDYAEKAAASLAYSGYRDEMSADPSLLERLRGSLLLKFAEHPERLLRKTGTTETLEVTSPGFKATSTTGKSADPSLSEASPEKMTDS